MGLTLTIRNCRRRRHYYYYYSLLMLCCSATCQSAMLSFVCVQVLSLCFPHRSRHSVDCWSSAVADVIRGSLSYISHQLTPQLWFSRIVFQSLGLGLLIVFSHKINAFRWRRTFIHHSQHKALFTNLCFMLIVESLNGDQLYLDHYY